MRSGPSGPRRLDWRSVPHPDRLRRDHPHREEILARHSRALRSGLSTYIDPGTGYSVFTADYLATRGYCCSNDCRHCPWVGGEQDPEPSPLP